MPQPSENARRKLSEPNLGFPATEMADGGPPVSPLWVDVDGDHVLVSAARGRLKERSLRRDPRVAISVEKTDEPYPLRPGQERPGLRIEPVAVCERP